MSPLPVNSCKVLFRLNFAPVTGMELCRAVLAMTLELGFRSTSSCLSPRYTRPIETLILGMILEKKFFFFL